MWYRHALAMRSSALRCASRSALLIHRLRCAESFVLDLPAYFAEVTASPTSRSYTGRLFTSAGRRDHSASASVHDEVMHHSVRRMWLAILGIRDEAEHYIMSGCEGE